MCIHTVFHTDATGMDDIEYRPILSQLRSWQGSADINIRLVKLYT